MKDTEKLITDNMKLVPFVLKRYIKIGDDDEEDLMQVGNLYLCYAAQRYDKNIGTTFSTYAVKYIMYGIMNYINTHGEALKGMTGIRKLQDERRTRHKNGENASYKIIDSISLQSNIASDGDRLELQELLSDDNSFIDIEDMFYTQSILDKGKEVLSDADYILLEYLIDKYERYGVIPKQKEIAKDFKITQSLVSRKIKQIYNKLFNKR